MERIKELINVVWKKPELHDMTSTREVKWIELFYDLVFVVLISHLAHALIENPSLDGVLRYTFLFLTVWFTWISSVHYFELTKVKGLSIAAFTFFKMLSVGAMTVSVHHAFGESSSRFAVGYIVHHGLTTYMFLRLLLHNFNHPKAKAGLPVPILFYGSSTVLFAISLLYYGELRLHLWGLALFIDFIMPLALAYKVGDKAAERPKLKMVERFGLMVIIVLGEGITGIINGLAEHGHLSKRLMLVGLIEFMIVFGLWFIYFKTVEEKELKAGVWWRQLWTYLHFVLFTSTVALGASMLYLIEYYEQVSRAKIFLASFGLTLLVLGGLEFCYEEDGVKNWDSILIRTAKILGGLIPLLLGLINIKVAPMVMLVSFVVIIALIVYLMLQRLAKKRLEVKSDAAE